MDRPCSHLLQMNGKMVEGGGQVGGERVREREREREGERESEREGGREIELRKERYISNFDAVFFPLIQAS